MGILDFAAGAGRILWQLRFQPDRSRDTGFFRPIEWLPVASSAFAVSFLLVPFVVRVEHKFLLLWGAILIVQALVGVLGFVLHVWADAEGPSTELLENVIRGAPPFAPLLFPNLVLLSLIALWVLRGYLKGAQDG